MRKKYKILIPVVMLITLLLTTSLGGVVNANKEVTETFPPTPVGNISADEYLALKVEGLLIKYLSYMDVDGMYRRRAGTWLTIQNELTTFANLKETYGGPACVKAICHYLAVYSPSQAAIAEALGTESIGTLPKKVVEYLNDTQSDCSYQLYTGENIHQLILNLHEGISAGRPVLLGVDFTTKDGWPYNSGRARYVVVYGLMTDMKHVAISDPYVNYAGLKEVKHYYSVSVEALFAAYKRAGVGLIY